jgi:hypothetical protein
MCIEGETGQDRDSLHEFFKRKFLEWQERTICGETMMVAPSTTTLDSHAFSQYMEKVRMFALELNIFLPYPEDKGYNEFYEQYS